MWLRWLPKTLSAKQRRNLPSSAAPDLSRDTSSERKSTRRRLRNGTHSTAGPTLIGDTITKMEFWPGIVTQLPPLTRLDSTRLDSTQLGPSLDNGLNHDLAFPTWLTSVCLCIPEKVAKPIDLPLSPSPCSRGRGQARNVLVVLKLFKFPRSTPPKSASTTTIPPPSMADPTSAVPAQPAASAVR
jgi:hypothetical protein